jgi:hypothetical protein
MLLLLLCSCGCSAFTQLQCITLPRRPVQPTLAFDFIPAMPHQQQGHDPASQSLAAHTTSVLNAIKANTAYLSLRANSEVRQCHPQIVIPYLIEPILQIGSSKTLSYKSMYIWDQIRLVSLTAPAELLRIWIHVEDYERYVLNFFCAKALITHSRV